MKSASRFFFLLLHTVLKTVPPSVWASGAAAAIVLAIGCQTPPTSASKLPSKERPNSMPDTAIALREGDFVKISFPNTPKLDSTQRVRRDGKVVLPVLGEVKALGLTPLELEKDILKQFGSQLVTKEVTVTLESSSYAVFVNGAVVHPGKIASERPLSALEAIMEAGGFDYAKANLKNVKIIRTEQEKVTTFTLDFRGVLQGAKSDPFYLKPSDIIYVSEKFTLF